MESLIKKKFKLIINYSYIFIKIDKSTKIQRNYLTKKNKYYLKKNNY